MSGGSLFGIMDVGISGMFASRVATQILNHNIANANTPGYSRQRLTLGAAMPLRTPYGTLGRGVVPLGVERMTDRFAYRQLLDQTAVEGSYSGIDQMLSAVENVLGSVDNDRIGTSLSAFFNAWGDLASTADPALKQGVVSAGQALALQLRDVDSGLRAAQSEARASIEGKVLEVNRKLAEVADLNGQIVGGSALNATPYDLVDRRDQLLAEIAVDLRVSIQEREDGSADVIIEGNTLVSRSHFTALRLTASEENDGSAQLELRFGNGNGIALTPMQGEIHGLLTAHNQQIEGVRRGLDAVAVSLIERVNALHGRGVTAGGTGVDFFTGGSASDIAVSFAVDENPALVVTGRSGEPGDNSIALEIAALGDVPDATGISLNERYNALLVDLASQRGSYSALLEGQISIVESVRVRLESVRGVSLDEEMADLVRYEQTFDANARVITAVNDMLDTLINGMI